MDGQCGRPGLARRSAAQLSRVHRGTAEYALGHAGGDEAGCAQHHRRVDADCCQCQLQRSGREAAQAQAWAAQHEPATGAAS